MNRWRGVAWRGVVGQAGELLRQERAKDSEDGKLIDEHLVQASTPCIHTPYKSGQSVSQQPRAMAHTNQPCSPIDVRPQGKIVPVRISLGLLRREMAASKARRFLVDGFPRNFDNVQVRARAPHTGAAVV